MLREEYEKETGNKCPEDVFNSLDYYHYEIRYSRWLESKLTAQNTINNSNYVKCKHWKTYNKGGSGEFGVCECRGNLFDT